MKKLVFTLLALIAYTSVMAGGMVHNTNQSAAWIRMPVRDAVIAADGVFYNPAGLVYLPDGFHFQVNNQTAIQTREVENMYPLLNESTYQGDVLAPVIPSAFAVYKTGKLAVSAGFTVIGGGGSADYAAGLPSFEIPVAGLPSMLTAAGIPTDAYEADIAFNGSSAYFGIQAGVSYKLHENISVAAGARYVMAQNTYEGHIRDIRINPTLPGVNDGTMMLATEFFTQANTYFTGVAASAQSGGDNLQPVIDADAGATPLADAGPLGVPVADVQAGLQALGIDPTGMTVAQAQGAFYTAQAQFEGAADQMAANGAAVTDKEVDATQTGSTFTPFVGANLNLMDGNLNIGLKYEFPSEMELENETKTDDTGMFPDGEKVHADLPGMLSVGADFKAMPALTLSAGFHYYGDKAMNYGKTLDGENVANDQVIDDNTYEVAFGAAYDLSEQFTLSAGYLYAKTSPSADYQSDLSYSLPSHSLGAGGQFRLNEAFSIDFGLLYTLYDTDEITIDYSDAITGIKESYYKDNIVFALGLGYRLGN